MFSFAIEKEETIFKPESLYIFTAGLNIRRCLESC